MMLPLEGGEAYPVKVARPGGSGSPATPDMPEEHSNDDHQRGQRGGGGGGGNSGNLSLNGYTFSPDGKTMSVVVADPAPPSAAKDIADKRDVVWVDHDERTRRLYLIDVATWKARVVPGVTDVDSVTWSEDSQKLLLINHLKNRDFGPSSVATIISVSDPTQKTKVEGFPISARRAVFMHNGKALVLLSKCSQDAPEGCSDLYTLDLASGKLKNLTNSLKDMTLAGNFTVQRTTIRAPSSPWATACTRPWRTSTSNTGSVKLIDLGLPVISGIRSDRARKGWVYMGSSSTNPASVYFTHSPDTPGVKLKIPELQPAGWASVPSKTMTWKAAPASPSRACSICRRKLLPEKFRWSSTSTDGPRGQFNDGYSPLTDLLLGQGYAVLNTNPRGSTGYGTAFEAANKDDMGNGDYLDIMMGVDEAIKNYPIDASKMALIGYSYGGEMAGFVEGKTDRFKAIVAGAPVIDQFSEYGTESGSYGDRWYTGMPWRNFESAWRQSPLAYASHAKTPFLLLQGEADTTDPEGQSKEYYRALRQEGVHVELLLVPRENHGPLGSNFSGRPSPEPWHGIIVREHMLKFIADGFNGTMEPLKP